MAKNTELPIAVAAAGYGRQYAAAIKDETGQFLASRRLCILASTRVNGVD